MSTDPYHHLALEEALLDMEGDAPPVLHVWRSRPAVVIGKNQIPWREADLEWMRDKGVLLCRRSSGGGAVYHDEGNLNWAVCVPRGRYSALRITEFCLGALAAAGVRAQAAGAASLVADGAKISGMAYAYRRDRVLHHGTLLGDADLDRLRRALRPPAGEWETHAVRSEPMPVRNIGGTKAEFFREALTKGFPVLFPDGRIAVQQDLQAVADGHAARLKSLDWLLGRSPRFRYEFRKEAGNPPVHARVFVEHGRVQAGSFLRCGGTSGTLREGEWFGAGGLQVQGVLASPEFAPLGDAAGWCGQ